MRLLTFWLEHPGELASMLGQHVALVTLSTLAAVIIGVPLGILAARRPRLGRPLIGLANVVQTIPSLALFGFLIPIPLIGGVGARAALVVLVLYGLLPILRTTEAGLRSIDRAIIESGLAMGMTPRQLLFQVELPLALPSIIAGVRVATVVGVGAATIAAAIGAGGLGEYIFRGLSMADPAVILAGAIPAAALALLGDRSLTWLERRLTTAHRGGSSRVRHAATAGAALIGLAAGSIALSASFRETVVVGSKNFTEQLILGEILAQVIESSGLDVERRLNLGGTFLCDRALRAGEIDVYAEYTGTALTAIFHQAPLRDSAAVYDAVRLAYARTGRTLLEPLGFSNTFAILVRAADADRLKLRTIGDLAPYAPEWRAGFGYEFLERDDGFRGLVRAYGLEFGAAPRVMDLTLSYRALADGKVDVIAGDRTSGLIEALDLRVLEDDRSYFPPYDAVPVVNSQTLLRWPSLGESLATMSGRISDEDMRAMNLAVDVHRRDIAAVAREFLARVR
jgi:osmoprotectant transport system permease protein